MPEYDYPFYDYSSPDYSFDPTSYFNPADYISPFAPEFETPPAFDFGTYQGEYADPLALPELGGVGFGTFEEAPLYGPAAYGTQSFEPEFGAGTPYLGGYNIGAGFDFGPLPSAPGDLSFGGSLYGGGLPEEPRFSLAPGLGTFAEPAAAAPSRDVFGVPGLTGNALLSAGLTAGGGLFNLLSKPKVDQELRAAQIDAIRAQAEAARAAAARTGGGGGGGGGGPLRPGGLANLQEFQGAAGLTGSAQRFSVLYDQVLKETADLPKPDKKTLDERAAEVEAVESQAVRAKFQEQRAAVQERAIRLGTNPAAELAKIAELEAQELATLRTQARTQALAYMQTEQATLLGRLTPTMRLMELLNPAQTADILARVYGAPRPG